MVGDSREHLAQKRFWIVAVEFGGAQQAVHGRSTITACIAAGKQIITPNRDAFFLNTTRTPFANSRSPSMSLNFSPEPANPNASKTAELTNRTSFLARCGAITFTPRCIASTISAAIPAIISLRFE
jgi:hypothetical protein